MRQQLPASPTGQQNFAICSLEGPCFYNLLVQSNDAWDTNDKLVVVTTVQSDWLMHLLTVQKFGKIDLDLTNKRVGFTQYECLSVWKYLCLTTSSKKQIFVWIILAVRNKNAVGVLRPQTHMHTKSNLLYLRQEGRTRCQRNIVIPLLCTPSALHSSISRWNAFEDDKLLFFLIWPQKVDSHLAALFGFGQTGHRIRDSQPGFEAPPARVPVTVPSPPLLSAWGE